VVSSLRCGARYAHLGSRVLPARWYLLVSAELALIHGSGDFALAGGTVFRLFEWNVFGLAKPSDYWQLSPAADGARTYLNTSFSIGFWH
jgi:hypothetical protein